MSGCAKTKGNIVAIQNIKNNNIRKTITILAVLFLYPVAIFLYMISAVKDYLLSNDLKKLNGDIINAWKGN